MKNCRIKPHPRFGGLSELLRRDPERFFKPWQGTLFRFQTTDYPAPRDVLSGIGARQRGGRWNPPGLSALYGSITDTAALEESKANDRYYGVETKCPRILVTIEVRLKHALDLNSPSIRRALGLTAEGLSAEDWRKELASGRESLTQAVGRAVALVGGDGLIARSASVRRGFTVAVYRDACDDTQLAVVGGDKLERLGATVQA